MRVHVGNMDRPYAGNMPVGEIKWKDLYFKHKKEQLLQNQINVLKVYNHEKKNREKLIAILNILL